MTGARFAVLCVMFFLRIPFLVGAFLHMVLLYTRVNIFELRCIGDECTQLVVADIPFSIVYFAFPDWLLILCSFVFGTLLWGLYGLGLRAMLQRIFKEV